MAVNIPCGLTNCNNIVSVKVIGDFTKKDPGFKKIIDSQKSYAKKVMKYVLMNQPNYKLAYENEFGNIAKVKI